MSTRLEILKSRYVDSVVLMRLAQTLEKRPGISAAAAVMATAANKQLLAEGGFVANGVTEAQPDDLVVAVKAADDAAAAAALGEIEPLLNAPIAASGLRSATTISDAVALQPDSNVAVISVPGEYAAGEARNALERGLHVFLFSSNVSLDDEIALKGLARERGLLCMGPDCGTAIVAGKGLGFANVVRRGPVGVVGAAGTGIQAVTSMLDMLGVGISHAIGTGGRDVSDEVGAATMTAGLEALLDDPGTETIVIVAKPPAPAVGKRLRNIAATAAKPVLCCFLGSDQAPRTLEEAAREAARLAGATTASDGQGPRLPRPAAGRQWIRGLYAGGTLGYEAQVVLRDAGLDVASNAPLPGGRPLFDATRSDGHSVIDLGAEEFTTGRPHPMIDARLRRERILAEAADPQAAVLLLDIVLGYGAAADPAGDLADALATAARELTVIASVCGTDGDPQGREAQIETLRRAGGVVMPTNAAAARAAAAVVKGGVA